MDCPICGNFINKSIPAKHLPRFLQCPNCSGYYHNEKTGEPIYYDTYFTDKERPSSLGTLISKFVDLYLLIYKRKIKKLIPSKNSLILDYGCGMGKFVSFLKKHDFQIDGYDPSDSAVSLGQTNNLPIFKKIPEKRYDLITFWHSLEHTDHPLHDLEKIKDRLNSKSKLWIAVPNGDSIEAHFASEKWLGYEWPFHRVHFTRHSLEIMLNKIGFRIIATDYWNLNYTLALMSQSFLNLFFAKNILYSLVSHRRVDHSKAIVLLGGIVSLILLVIASPLLLTVFISGLLTKRTGAMIVIAEPILNAQTITYQ